jgi:purine-binding chemotaxis protein CheW
MPVETESGGAGAPAALAASEPPGAAPVSPAEEAEAEDQAIARGPGEYLAVRLAQEEYAIEIARVKEIIRPLAITWVPRALEYVIGVISLRGTVIPIFDLKRRLGFNVNEVGRYARIVVVTLGETLAGIMVDAVTEVVRLDPSEIEPPPMTVGAAGEHLKGVARHRGRLLIFIDLEQALLAARSPADA